MGSLFDEIVDRDRGALSLRVVAARVDLQSADFEQRLFIFERTDRPAELARNANRPLSYRESRLTICHD